MDYSSRPGDRHGRHWPQRLLASSDEQLVERVLEGEDLAFDLLFERHIADALWFAREVLGSQADAEEAVSHSFAAAHAYLAAREREVEFGPWLQTILGNHCLSILHARGPRPRRPAEVVDLGEWRHRRHGRLGLAAPLAPLAGLREGVLALCGIGGTGAAATGAAGGGASLVAGTLAKVAVAALLVGGAGAAGDAVTERQRAPAVPAVETGRGPTRTAAIVDPTALGVGDLREAAARVRARPDGDDRRRGEPVTGEVPEGPDTPAAEPVATPVPAAQPVPTPGGSVPAVPVASAPAAAGHPAPADAGRTAAIAEPIRATLGAPPDVVLPKPLEALPEPALPIVETVTEIGEDLGVPTEPLAEDVAALLQQEPAATTP